MSYGTTLQNKGTVFIVYRHAFLYHLNIFLTNFSGYGFNCRHHLQKEKAKQW